MKTLRSNIFNLCLAAVMLTSFTGCTSTSDNLTQNTPVETAVTTTVETTMATTTETTVAETTTAVEEIIQVDTHTSTSVSKSIDDIKALSKYTAPVETDTSKCLVDVRDKHNPYDVVWDYGDVYNNYVDACDWSLVFDADYYKKAFPMLALLYHNDDDLLLEHFQTVGIHEGRQGSAKFNLGAYCYNNTHKLTKSFGKNFECYYFYYMLNYDTEKKVNTVTAKNNKPIYQQYTQCFTSMQREELEEINYYRKEVNVDNVLFDGELAAFANYRAYINASDDKWTAHKWVIDNSDTVKKYMFDILKGNTFSENTITRYSRYANSKVMTFCYRNSTEGHYETMISADNHYVGTSNWYHDDDSNHQFDVYLDDLTTIIHY